MLCKLQSLCWTAYVTLKDIAYLPQNRETLVITAEAVGVAIAAFAAVLAIGIWNIQ